MGDRKREKKNSLINDRHNKILQTSHNCLLTYSFCILSPRPLSLLPLNWVQAKAAGFTVLISWQKDPWMLPLNPAFPTSTLQSFSLHPIFAWLRYISTRLWVSDRYRLCLPISSGTLPLVTSLCSLKGSLVSRTWHSCLPKTHQPRSWLCCSKPLHAAM